MCVYFYDLLIKFLAMLLFLIKNDKIQIIQIVVKKDKKNTVIEREWNGREHVDSFLFIVHIHVLCMVSYRHGLRSSAYFLSKHHHHHSCRSHTTKTTFISSTTLLSLSINLAVVTEISTSWYQYPFSLGFSWLCLCSGDVGGHVVGHVVVVLLVYII